MSTGLDLAIYLRFVAALAAVLALIAAGGWLLRRFGSGGLLARAGNRRRTGIVEVTAVDARRRLVLLRRDNVEHLVLIGGAGNDVVIETGIPAQPTGTDRLSTGGPAVPAPTDGLEEDTA